MPFVEADLGRGLHPGLLLALNAPVRILGECAHIFHHSCPYTPTVGESAPDVVEKALSVMAKACALSSPGRADKRQGIPNMPL